MKLDTLTRHAITHTLHCLLGCSIGEILGMVISAWLGFSNTTSIAVSIILAFFFGYMLTFQAIYRRNRDARAAVKTALATDTVSIISMETVDNLFILAVPGALSAGLSTVLFWWSLLVSLIVAFTVTVPVNRFMLSRSDSNHSHH